MNILFSFLVLFLTSCVGNVSNPQKALAIIYDLETTAKLGVAYFQDDSNGNVIVKLELKNITPGEHGLHIHKYGDISANGANLGGHFNPFKVSHGNPQNGLKVHVGDLGNITANNNGSVNTEFTDYKLSLRGKNSILGRSIVIHAHKDNFTTQPSGHSGKKIAAGVIAIAK